MDDVVVVSAGIAAGHDGAAAELERRLALRGASVSRVDLLGLLPAGLGTALREAYRIQLGLPGSWDRVYALSGHRRFAAASADLVGALACRRLCAVTATADAVVTTHPLAGQALGRLRRSGRLSAPVAIYLTDMSVHPLWVAPGADLHLALHPEPACRAMALGARSVRVVAPAVRPAFRPLRGGEAERRRVRRRHGLPDDRPLALVVAGSWGVGAVADTVRDVARDGTVLPVALCGRNAALRRRIERDGAGTALGWTEEMAPLLGACDVVIQNAGGLTSLEALAAGAPVLSYRCIGGHGVENSLALHRAGLARYVRNPAELSAALAGLAHHRAPGPAPWHGALHPDPADVILGLGPAGPAAPRRLTRTGGPAARRRARREALAR